MGKAFTPLNEKFSASYTPEPNTGCWLWTGVVDHDGYGKAYRGHGLSIRAHRLSLILDGRPPREDQVAMHLCNQPGCVNPRHLRAGTVLENTLQSWREGRRNLTSRARGERAPTAKLTEQKVREIRELFSRGVRRNELARRYGVKFPSIDKICLRQSWRHVA